jgi:hypothetical protein
MACGLKDGSFHENDLESFVKSLKEQAGESA